MENMENGTVNNPADGQQQSQAQERTFTQEEVNRIVQERLARAKTSQEPDERELALRQRENDLYAREQIAEQGLPKELYEELKGMDKENIDKFIKIIAPYAKKAGEPIRNPVTSTYGAIARENPLDDSIRSAMGLNQK